MEPHELARFLAMVRRKSFVDYLDPIGETALQALERRLRWADLSKRDPAYVDEAAFLMRHAASLRDLVRTMPEAEEDDWAEDDASAYSANTKSKWNVSFDEDPSDERPPDEVPTGIMQIDDVTDPPAPIRRDISPSLRTPAPVARKPGARVFEDPWSIPPPDAAEDSGTAPSAEPRTHAGAAPRSRGSSFPMLNVFEPTGTGTSASAPRAESWSDDDFGKTIVPDDMDGPFVTDMLDGQTIVPDELEELEEIEIDVSSTIPVIGRSADPPRAPSRPPADAYGRVAGASTSSSPRQVGVVPGRSSSASNASKTPVSLARAPVQSSRPPGPPPLKRALAEKATPAHIAPQAKPPSPASSSAAVPRRSASSLEPGPISPPVRRRAGPAPAIGGVLALLLLLGGGWYALEALDHDEPIGEAEAIVSGGARTVPSAPVPVETPVAVAPAPVAPAPGAVAPVPVAVAAVAPAPAPAPVVAAPNPVAPEPTPAPVLVVAPPPKPVPAPVVAAPKPAPAPPPKPAAEPVIAAAAPALTGAWSGYLASGDSVSLSVASVEGSKLSGTVSVPVGGAPATIPVAGTFDAASSGLRFSGGDFAFSGTLAGTTARGTCTVSGVAGKCSLRH